MAELPYISLVVNDEMAEWGDLTNEELGALIRIKFALWKTGGFLPDDSKQISRIARAGSRWGKVAPAVMALLTVAGGKISSPSLLGRLLITRERRVKKVKAGEARQAKPDIGLNACKPLISHEAGGDCAGVVLEHPASNYNYKRKTALTDTAEDNSAPAREAPPQGAGEEATEKIAATPELAKSTLIDTVVKRSNQTRWYVESRARDWLPALGGDLDELKRIVGGLGQHNFSGQVFLDKIGEAVKTRADELAHGRPLPGLLGPQMPAALAARLAKQRQGGAA